MASRYIGLLTISVLWLTLGISLVACIRSDGFGTSTLTHLTPSPTITLTPQVLKAPRLTYTTTPSSSMSVKTTENENKAWHELYFRDRPMAITHVGVKVRIQGGANFVIPAGEESLLSVGNQLVSSDDHGKTTYTIIQIREDGIEIEYTSEFDHNAFGENLLTLDHGKFWVRYKA